MTEDQQTPLTPGERQELRRILKAREELLTAQLDHRVGEIKDAIRERINDEASERIGIGQDRLRAFTVEIDALHQYALALQKDLEKMGLVCNKRNRTRGSRWDGDLIEIDFADTVEVKNLRERVEEEFHKLAREHGFAQLNLRGTFLELQEELAQEGLVSGRAKAFLDRIPRVESLLPMPTPATQIGQ